jgi:hypothetical protein
VSNRDSETPKKGGQGSAWAIKATDDDYNDVYKSGTLREAKNIYF